MSLLARSVATLEGIALTADPQYQMVAQVGEGHDAALGTLGRVQEGCAIRGAWRMECMQASAGVSLTMCSCTVTASESYRLATLVGKHHNAANCSRANPL